VQALFLGVGVGVEEVGRLRRLREERRGETEKEKETE